MVNGSRFRNGANPEHSARIARKESYQLISSNEIVETFYLAAPAKEFERYSETRLKRI
jgi:hypothetical protein